LEMLISEARQKVKIFEEGHTDYIGYVREFRNRIQHCLLDIGQVAQDELRQIATLDLSISEGLQRYYDARIFNDFDVKSGDSSEFLRLQNEYNQTMPAKIRKMITLMEQVRYRMLNFEPYAKSRRQIRPFHKLIGSTWADVVIRFTSDFQVEITVGKHRELRTYIEMGFEDGRSGKRTSKPDQNWEALRAAAESSGAIGFTKDASEWRKIEKRVQVLNRRLKKLFGFSENPIAYVRKAKAYEVLFKLIPPPNC
jgi:hypothetical protein